MYSVTAWVARWPCKLRRVIRNWFESWSIVSAVFKSDGWTPETRAALAGIRPELFEGSRIKQEYDRLAPDPKHWPQFVAQIKQASAAPFDLTPQVKSLTCPTFVILGDSDGIRPEHGAELFHLRGGGAMGDLAGLPNSQFAILPG